MNIGESEVATEMVPGQSRVVDAKQVQHRGMQVVNVDLSVDDVVAHVIGLAIGEPTFYAAARHPSTKTLGLMLSTVFLYRRGAAEILTPGCATELSRPKHQSILKQSSLFQILEQSGNWLIGLFAESREIAANVAVMVPAVHGNLHKPHARFAEFPSKETCATMFVSLVTADTVEVKCCLAFVREIDQLRCRGLHAEGQFHVLDHPFHVGIAVQVIQQSLIQSLRQMDALLLNRFAGGGIFEVLYRQCLFVEWNG